MDRGLQALYGSAGGRSSSATKRRAARANGRLSDGRPRTRTLGEMILRRKLKPQDYSPHVTGAALYEAWLTLTPTERAAFNQRYLRAQYRTRSEKKFRKLFHAQSTFPDFRTKHYNPVGKPSEVMSYILRKFRMAARHHLAQST